MSTEPTIHQVTPHLVCRGAAEAIDFYAKAFGAVEQIRLPGPDGKLMHACIQIGPSLVFLVDEMLEVGNRSPLDIGGTPVTLHLQVDDSNAVAAQAVSAGGTVMMPVADQFWGDRYGVVQDPFGHLWAIGQGTDDSLTDQASLEQALADSGAGMPSATGADRA